MDETFVDSTKLNVMISYSHKNTELMLRIRDLLSSNNFEVWVDTKLQAGCQFFKNIGSAVIGCDIFLFILTEHSVASKFCEDEVSLARISNKKILPVTFCNPMDISSEMNPGLRLILSCTQWVCLDPEVDDDQNDRQIVKNLNQALQLEHTENSRLDNYDIAFSEEKSAASVGQHDKTLHRTDCNLFIEPFWERNFGETKKKVEVKKVLAHIKEDYKFDYEKLGFDDTQTAKALALWCFDLPHHETVVTKDQYDMFVYANGYLKGKAEGPDTFWIRCKDGFSMELTMGQVFNGESSVRYGCIENLGDIKNKRFTTMLYKLLKDSDPNIRAVACIALPRTVSMQTMNTTIERVQKLLKDPDRLVRQSACVALGVFKKPGSVPALLITWRNDVISDVRNSALKSLETIGTTEALDGIKVVKTLQDEIKKLGM